MKYYDKETEEVYLRARYYQPVVGRFLTRDTYTGEEDEPLSLHLYTYCENDGVNQVDPSGYIPTPMEAAMMCQHIYEPKKFKDKIDNHLMETVIKALNEGGFE